jgi:hypothetical protein
MPVASDSKRFEEPEKGVCFMLKKALSAMSFAALMLWVTSPAQAAPITFTDLIAPAVPVYLNGDKGPKTHTVTHNITDGVPLPAFIPGFHILGNATLKMTLDDDLPRCCIDTGEFMKITVGGTDYGPWEVDHMDVFSIALNSAALADLNLDGTISATITMTNRGDLNFISSELVANTASLPEPSTFILLGSGLAGVVGFGLKRRKHEEEQRTEATAI